MMISTSAAIGPIVLGQGKLNNAVNLNVGAEQSPITPYFGSNGFAAPSTPQPMELDPGALVSQSGRLKDQSQALRDQSNAIYNDTCAVLNRTTAVAEDVKRTGIEVEDLKRQADLSASSSLQSSLMARDYLNDTRGVYNSTRAVYNRTRITARNIEMAASMNVIGGRSIAKYTGTMTNDVESLQQEISFLSQRLDALQRRVDDLESGEQVN
jgi:hypothetical protein